MSSAAGEVGSSMQCLAGFGFTATRGMGMQWRTWCRVTSMPSNVLALPWDFTRRGFSTARSKIRARVRGRRHGIWILSGHGLRLALHH